MNLTLLKYNEKPVRQFLDDNGEPWWVASDVCEILGLSGGAYKRLDEDEKGSKLIQTLGGMQNMVVVNEAGLNTLVIRCRKTEAKPVIRWFTHEILPSIRKTGAYSVPTTKQVVTEMYPPLHAKSSSLVSQVEMLLAVVKQQEAIEAQVTETKQIVTEMKQVASEALKVAEEVKESTRHDNGYMHVSSYARKLKVYIDTEHSKKIGMDLSKYCRQNGIEIHKIDHPYYPQGVNAYPTEVLDMHKYLCVSPV